MNLKWNLLFGRFKAWMHRKVWKAAQCSYIKGRWPDLHHRVLTDCALGKWRGKLSHSELHKLNQTSYICWDFINNLFSRLWCLWSMVGRAPETSPTHRCWETSRRPWTSAYASSAPTPCWAISFPRRRETPLSHAGWDTHTAQSRTGCCWQFVMFSIWAN